MSCNPHRDIGGQGKVSVFSSNQPCKLHEGSTWLPARSLPLLLMSSKTLIFHQCNCRLFPDIVLKLGPVHWVLEEGLTDGEEGLEVRRTRQNPVLERGRGSSKEKPESSRKGDLDLLSIMVSFRGRKAFWEARESPWLKVLDLPARFLGDPRADGGGMRWPWMAVNIEAFPAPFASDILLVDYSLCSAHTSPVLVQFN